MNRILWYLLRQVKLLYLTYIETYLSPLNEHYMIAPCDCLVKKIEDTPRSTDMERKRVTLEDGDGNIIKLEAAVSKLGQGSWIPNIIVRERVIFSIENGDKLKKGDRIGMVRFGSEMAYYIPKQYTFLGKLNEFFKVGSKIAVKNT